jgi:hydroxyacylglutathione hydrolase
MFMRMVYDEKLAEAAYLIGCQRTGEAVVIDPQRDIDRYERLAAQHGLRIVATAETHIHADFLSGSRELAEKGAHVFVSDEGDADWKYQWMQSRTGGGAYAHTLLKDGDSFMVGNIRLTAVHTPGHTPEHLCYLVTDLGGGATEPMGVASGDFMFVGDLGRPDLLESAAGIVGKADPSAHRLFATVQRVQREWPDWLQVWPGHGAGSACGKALGAVPTTTMGYERRFNPALQAASSEERFVNFILDGQPEPPMYFARMKRDNKLGPRVLGALPTPRRLDAAELAAMDGRSTAIIDTRTWTEFMAGHLRGAFWFPVNAAFNTDAGSMIRDDEPIVLIIDPSKLDEAIRDLVRIGLDRIEGWYDAREMDAVRASGAALESTEELTPAEANALIERERPFVLDVRRATEHAADGRVEGAHNIAHTRLATRLAEIPKDRTVLVHCRGGIRSARSCALLQRQGHRVVNLAGGMLAWQKSGQPTQM